MRGGPRLKGVTVQELIGRHFFVGMTVRQLARKFRMSRAEIEAALRKKAPPCPTRRERLKR